MGKMEMIMDQIEIELGQRDLGIQMIFREVGINVVGLQISAILNSDDSLENKPEILKIGYKTLKIGLLL